MYEGGPSPLAQIVLTLLVGEYMTTAEIPAIIKDEVNYFYSFIVGKPIKEDGQE